MRGKVTKGIFTGLISLAVFCAAAGAATYSVNVENARKKLSEVSDQICLDVVKNVTSEMGLSKEAIDAIGEQGMALKAKELSAEFMQIYENAFIVGESEALKVLAGQFDETKNKSIIEKCVKKMATLNESIPAPIGYLIEKSSKGALTGIESEFAARVFSEYVRQKGK